MSDVLRRRRRVVLGGAGKATPWYLAGGVPKANCLVAYQPRGAASLAASYVNLAHPGTNDAVVGSAPTWDQFGGWSFDGIANYLMTGIIPSSGYSFVIKFSDMQTNGGYVFGSAGGTTSRLWMTLNTTTVSYGNGGSKTVTRYDMYGIYAGAGTVGYKNGTSDVTAIPGWSGTGREVAIGAVNSAGTISGFANVKIQFFAIYNTTLTPAQITAITTAITTADTAPTTTLPRNLVNTPAVLLWFDDDDASVYAQAFDYLVSRNAPITMSIITGNENTAAKVEKLHDQEQRGFCCVNHTTSTTTLAGLDLATQTTRIGDAQTWLASRGFYGSYFVAPQASMDATTVTVMANLGILLHRHLSAAPFSFDLATVDLMALNAADLTNTTTLTDAEAIVDAAVSGNQAVIFYGHQLVVGAPAANQWNTQDFKDLVAYCIARGVALITAHDLYRLRAGAVSVRRQV